MPEGVVDIGVQVDGSTAVEGLDDTGVEGVGNTVEGVGDIGVEGGLGDTGVVGVDDIGVEEVEPCTVAELAALVVVEGLKACSSPQGCSKGWWRVAPTCTPSKILDLPS